MDKGYLNVMEEIVDTLVTVLLISPDYQTFCRCNKCKAEVISLSLNSLPSHYVTTGEGRNRAFEHLNTTENMKWINKKIISALHVVAKYPKHTNTL